MRIKTGETATVSVKVDVNYRCSSCGADNQSLETIEGTATTGTILGFNLDRNLSQHAKQNLLQNLIAISNPDDPDRFKKARLTCKCRSCGHTEPWAKLSHPRLDKIYRTVLVFLFTSAIMFVCFLFTLKYRDRNVGNFLSDNFVFLGLIAVCAAVCVGIRLYISKHDKKMEEEIAALPEKSIPTIRPHNSSNTSSSSHNI